VSCVVFCIFQLRQLRSFLRSLSADAANSLVEAFTSTCLDYCNSLFYGITVDLFRRLYRPFKICGGSLLLRQFLNSFTGCQSDSEWISNWQCWCSKHCMTLQTGANSFPPDYKYPYLLTYSLTYLTTNYNLNSAALR